VKSVVNVLGAFMQNKPNFSNTLMSINFCLTKHYKQKPPLRQPAKQTQSKPNKPNSTSVFDSKIGFEHSKPAGKAYGKTPQFENITH
jgi:hypothetical protein